MKGVAAEKEHSPDSLDVDAVWRDCKERASQQEEVDAGTRNWIFAALCVLEVMGNFEYVLARAPLNHTLPFVFTSCAQPTRD